MPTVCSTCGRTSGKCESCTGAWTPDEITQIQDQSQASKVYLVSTILASSFIAATIISGCSTTPPEAVQKQQQQEEQRAKKGNPHDQPQNQNPQGSNTSGTKIKFDLEDVIDYGIQLVLKGR